MFIASSVLSQNLAGAAFWLFPLSAGQGKKAGKVELGFGDRISSSNAEACRLRGRGVCIQEPLHLLLPSPSPQVSQSQGLVQCLGW